MNLVKKVVHAPHMTGLGDAVEVAMKPAVKVIEKWTGKSLAGCGGCRGRKELLNRLVPFGRDNGNRPK